MILKNCEIWHVRLDPKRPDAKFDKVNPRWTVQCRTDNPAQKEEWVAAGLAVKLMVHNKGEQEGEPMLNERNKKQWRINLQKKSKKKDGSPSDPVKVVNGSLEDIDPNSVGNGSIANLRIYQYPSKKEGEEDKMIAMLMSVQIVKHKVYKAKPREEFEMTETEVYEAEENGFDDDDDDTPSTPKPTPSPKKPVDENPEDSF
jgi:hypothetical protein